MCHCKFSSANIICAPRGNAETLRMSLLSRQKLPLRRREEGTAREEKKVRGEGKSGGITIERSGEKTEKEEEEEEIRREW